MNIVKSSTYYQYTVLLKDDSHPFGVLIVKIGTETVEKLQLISPFFPDALPLFALFYGNGELPIGHYLLFDKGLYFGISGLIFTIKGTASKLLTVRYKLH